jgi:thiamine-phosphate pyrophosphorylase
VQPPIICLVTGGAGGRPLLDAIVEAAQAGVDLIQIRERDLDDRTLLELTRRAVDATRDTLCRILVNDRFDIAMSANASGVHLRSDSFPATRIRAAAPLGFLIGRSVHDAAEADAAAPGCDYLIFGTVFPSMSKPAGHHASGLPALREVCAAVKIPVLAIGGISTENVSDVVSAGAAGVAAMSLFRGPEPVASIVSMVRRRFDT